MEDLTGKQLGPYRIVASLGEGGMAAVYKAFQPAMDRYVALKILPRTFAEDPLFVGRFEHEAKVIAKLQHIHILPVHDYGEAEGYTYIVMPFVEGGTLTGLLHSKPLPLKQIASIVWQVGDALDYAHTRGIVHRDVKPSNILIDQRGNCLLTDFGIAKMIEGTTRFTVTGGIIGTPAYMSPEQGLGQQIDARSDIYALGVILYEMATGQVPFQAETPMAIIVKHINDPLPLPRRVNPAISEALERVILKSMAKNPADRYQTAGELGQAVRAITDNRPEPSTPLQAGPTVIEPSSPSFVPTAIEAPFSSPSIRSAPNIPPAAPARAPASMPSAIPAVDQPGALDEGFRVRWIMANGVGGCLGLTLAGLVIAGGISLILAISESVGADTVNPPPQFLAAFVAAVGVAAGLFGAAVGAAQWMVLRQRLSGWWPIVAFVVATGLGALLGTLFVIIVLVIQSAS
jgi:serine/threonine protein kinase